MLRVILLAVVAIQVVQSASRPCCVTCNATTGKEKYYSIDKIHNMCGECCMKPKNFWLFKIFEPGLTKAKDNTPCADFDFHNYTETVTHGFGPLSMTLDLYAPDSPDSPDATQGNGTIVIEDFSSPVHTWKQQNDPVMGGRSTGTFIINQSLGIFNGSVVDVPFLKAPGFIKAETKDLVTFPDVSSCEGLTITSRASNNYSGYRLSFGIAHAPGAGFFSFGYKTHFNPPVGSFGPVFLPFKNFSDMWDDATGKIITPCSENPAYCPDSNTLRNMMTIGVWAEGVKGDINLEIQRIEATGCSSSINSHHSSRSASLEGLKSIIREAVETGNIMKPLNDDFQSSDNCTDYYRIQDGVCADTCLGSSVGICPVNIIVKFGGLSEGNCASRNYSVPKGQISQKAGPCGTINFDTYTEVPNRAPIQCSQPVQENLRFNMSDSQAAENFPFPLPPTESMPQALCCDPHYTQFAEPQGTYARNDVNLFAHLNANGTTTFYDSSCGIPLFIAPMNRSLTDFETDTKEHGWPSFRTAEVVPGNSFIDHASGFVFSKCGTHLGSYLPDTQGPRWCMDLSCISGNPL